MGSDASKQSSEHACSVLLVDDEPLILRSISRLLCRRGFQVVTALDVARATKLLEENAATFDVAVIDVELPVTSGRVLGERILERWPHIGLIFVSGVTDVASIPKPSVFLSKPYGIPSLVAQIHAAQGGNG